MDRNFRKVNGLPNWPRRSCLKRIGPLDGACRTLRCMKVQKVGIQGWIALRSVLIPILRENVQRNTELAEALRSQAILQRLADPIHHRADNRAPVVGADFREHHSYDGRSL